MREELRAGVEYIVSLANRRRHLDPRRLEMFRLELTTLLCQKFAGHWYPENPSKGQAYRCIRVSREEPAEDLLLQACARSGLLYSHLSLPKVMTLWIDPCEVCCRLGDNSRPYTVATFELEKGSSEKSALAMQEQDTSDYYSDVQSASSSDDEGTGIDPPKVSTISPTAQETKSVYRATPLWVPDWRIAQSYLTAFHSSGYFYPDSEHPGEYSPISM
ncbi:protein BTG3-like [Ambystoma mexicanum]|uniref:protein BTG3-like n=1 Tax=Ambystoma mexicanum TaxID=8296 RepID=UPI0037E8D463